MRRLMTMQEIYRLTAVSHLDIGLPPRQSLWLLETCCDWRMLLGMVIRAYGN